MGFVGKEWMRKILRRPLLCIRFFPLSTQAIFDERALTSVVRPQRPKSSNPPISWIDISRLQGVCILKFSSQRCSSDIASERRKEAYDVGPICDFVISC